MYTIRDIVRVTKTSTVSPFIIQLSLIPDVSVLGRELSAVVSLRFSFAYLYIRHPLGLSKKGLVLKRRTSTGGGAQI